MLVCESMPAAEVESVGVHAFVEGRRSDPGSIVDRAKTLPETGVEAFWVSAR